MVFRKGRDDEAEDSDEVPSSFSIKASVSREDPPPKRDMSDGSTLVIHPVNGAGGGKRTMVLL